ncbi:Protein XAP5 CIRCADIAN TIMEKEEPER [Vitis vinifera]|uniref:Protein XAP5 CIRCADIAN TIMEKEEPER n=1 Tax=Vitis vinifera TaxID=29760 RepID=A0A438IIP4_VITVI|nr:Protein XAP5 CIRCADIAN TIMEKEEPER [Vitis vinifera]
MSHAPSRAGRRSARGRRVEGFLAPMLLKKLEISSRRSSWCGRCRKKTSPEKFAGKGCRRGGDPTTMRLFGVGREENEGTGVKHGHWTILDTAFKKETVGLVTREEYVEKEEELQLQKRKKRKIKGNSRLSFSDDIENGSEEEDGENVWVSPMLSAEGKESKKFGKFGKDPTVETSFLPDSEREAEEQAERERLRKLWLREQEQIRNEPLEITYSYWDGAGHRRVIQVRKGDSIGEFLRAVQQQLAPEFREIRTTSVENLLYVKEDLIIPHLFHFDVHEDVRTIADATIEKDEANLILDLLGCSSVLLELDPSLLAHVIQHENPKVLLSPMQIGVHNGLPWLAWFFKDPFILVSHAGKVVERHWYEKNKHIFPASRWEIYDPTKKWERYTIHGD